MFDVGTNDSNGNQIFPMLFQWSLERDDSFLSFYSTRFFFIRKKSTWINSVLVIPIGQQSVE